MISGRNFTILFFLACLLVFFQAPLFGQYMLQMNEGTLNYRVNPSDIEVDGSPYYKDQWQRGVLYEKDGVTYEVPEMKYNVVQDEITFSYNGNVYNYPKKHTISAFDLGGDRFVGVVMDDSDRKYKFFKVVAGDEKLYLLKEYDGILKKGEPSKGYIPATNDSYTVKEKLYLKTGLSDPLLVDTNDWQPLLSLVEDSRKELISEFIKDHKLKAKREEDLISAIEFYLKSEN